MHDVTTVLIRLGLGDKEAAEKLLPLVYDHLRAQASAYFRGQGASHTLQPTALVHEAYLRLVKQDSVSWKDRAHFFAVAATAMRQILTDHARGRRVAKRGGGWKRVTLDAAVTPPSEPEIDTVVLDAALTRLAVFDERKHRVAILRFFGGLTVEEVAEIEAVSKSTVESEWRSARAWLSHELSKGGEA